MLCHMLQYFQSDSCCVLLISVVSVIHNYLFHKIIRFLDVSFYIGCFRSYGALGKERRRGEDTESGVDRDWNPTQHIHRI